jgi:hypothetical protein
MHTDEVNQYYSGYLRRIERLLRCCAALRYHMEAADAETAEDCAQCHLLSGSGGCCRWWCADVLAYE